MKPHLAVLPHYRVKQGWIVTGGGTHLSLVVFLAPHHWHVNVPWASCSCVSYPNESGVLWYSTISATLKQNSWNLLIAICVNIDIISPLCTCDKILFIMSSVDGEIEWLHNGSWLLCSACVLASCFQQLCNAGLKLSLVRPKVFDATACSYLTRAHTLHVCTIHTMPHELYIWGRGGGEKTGCSLKGGAISLLKQQQQKETLKRCRSCLEMLNLKADVWEGCLLLTGFLEGTAGKSISFQGYIWLVLININ